MRRFLEASLVTAVLILSLGTAHGDGAPGALKWSYETGFLVSSSPAIGADGTVYVGSQDSKLYAMSPNGALRWSCATGGPISSSPAIGADGTVYVGSEDRNLHTINPNGTFKWSYATGRKIYTSSPAIGTDGTVFIGSEDRKLHAVHSASKGLAESPWPMFRLNTKHAAGTFAPPDAIRIRK